MKQEPDSFAEKYMTSTNEMNSIKGPLNNATNDDVIIKIDDSNKKPEYDFQEASYTTKGDPVNI
jgi:hypothetical protein